MGYADWDEAAEVHGVSQAAPDGDWLCLDHRVGGVHATGRTGGCDSSADIDGAIQTCHLRLYGPCLRAVRQTIFHGVVFSAYSGFGVLEPYRLGPAISGRAKIVGAFVGLRSVCWGFVDSSVLVGRV